MSETMNMGTLFSELKAIRKDLDYIKDNMVDRDTVLSAAEHKELDEALEEYKSGKCISLKEFKKSL